MCQYHAIEKKRNCLTGHETVLSHSRSYDAALSRPDALWLLYVGEVRDDGGIWSVGIPVLHETEDGGYRHIHGAGATVSAHLQDCAGASNMECDRRVGGCATHCFVCIGEANGKENNGGLSAVAATRPCSNRRQHHRVYAQWQIVPKGTGVHSQ